MNQNLKIKKFLGASENAIRIQIAVALIAYLLLKLAHSAQKSSVTLLAFTRLVRSNLMHLRQIDRLLGAELETSPDDSQMTFLCVCKLNRTAVGLTRPSSHNLKYLVFFWMAASKGGHDDGIGGNIRVIKKEKIPGQGIGQGSPAQGNAEIYLRGSSTGGFQSGTMARVHTRVS